MIRRLCHIAVGSVLLVSLVVQVPAAALDAASSVEQVIVDEAGQPESSLANEEIESAPDEMSDLQAMPEKQELDIAVSSQPDSLVEVERVDSKEPEPQTMRAAVEPPVEIPPLPPVVTELLVNGPCTLGIPTGVQIADCSSTTYKDVDYFELYNPNATPLPLEGTKVFYSRNGVLDQSQLPLITFDNEEIAPFQSVIVGRNVSTSFEARIAQFSQNLIQSGGALYVVKDGAVLDELAWGDAQTPSRAHSAGKPVPGEALQRCLVGEVPYQANPRDASLEFIYYMSDPLTPGRAILCPPLEPESSVNLCKGLKLSEIAANVEAQYVEIYNVSAVPLDMTGCRLQTNRSQVFYSFPERQLQPGEYLSIFISDTDLTLTKTTMGTVYLLSSDGSTEIDSQSYANLAKDTAWALFGDVWKQTYVVTAGEANRYQQYLPCEAGYERNDETGRCRKIETVESPVDCGEGRYRSEETGRCRNLSVEATLAVCDENQYRSPETNRCRNLVSATTVTPCKEGQYRSPETNRCRSLATAAVSELKPCAVGQERNPATNRCRKAVSEGDAGAGFKVVDTPASSDRMMSWLALGGVGFMSFGYALWEWRRELIDGIGKLIGFLPFVK